jgi:hypothetical protein
VTPTQLGANRPHRNDAQPLFRSFVAKDVAIVGIANAGHQFRRLTTPAA